MRIRARPSRLDGTGKATAWSGTIPLKAGLNQIYARATDTSGNAHVVEITVIANGRPPASTSDVDPTIPVLLVFSSIGALVGAHAFLVGRSRLRRGGPKRTGQQKKKETVVVQQPKVRDPWLLAGRGFVNRQRGLRPPSVTGG